MKFLPCFFDSFLLPGNPLPRHWGILSAFALAVSSPVHAAQYWWDAGIIGGTGNGTSTFGSGTWSTSNANWDQGNGLARVSWPTSGINVAIFGGASSGANANVTLGSDVTVSQIVINPTGSFYYNFTGSSVTFNGTYSAATPTISSAAASKYLVEFGSRITGDLSTSGGLVLALGGNPSAYSPVNSDRFALTNTTNDFIGDITITSGSFRFEYTFGELGNASNRVILNGGGIVAYSIAGTYNINRQLIIGNNGGVINMIDTTYNLNQALSGSGNLSFYGAVTGFLNLTSDLSGYTGNLTNQSGTTTINSTVASGGQWTVTSGTLRFGASNKIVGGPGNRGNFTLNGGVLDLNGTTQSINGLAGSAGMVSSSIAGAVTLTLGSGDASASYAGTIANGHGSAVVSVTKTGVGTQTLSSANTYTGTTIVNQGTLVLSGSGSFANSVTVDVGAGATLDTSGVTGGTYTFGTGQALKGSGTLIGNQIVNGALQPGNSPGVLTFTGNLTLGSFANSTFEIQSGTPIRGTTYDGVTVNNLLTYAGTLTLSLTTLVSDGTYNLFDFASFGGNFGSVAFAGGGYTGSFTHNLGIWSATSNGQNFSFTLVSGDLIISAIPEPSTALLFALGLLTLRLRKRRK